MLHGEQDICAKIRKLEEEFQETPMHLAGSILWNLRKLRDDLYWEIEERRNWE